jgi:hypothetical protein
MNICGGRALGMSHRRHVIAQVDRGRDLVHCLLCSIPVSWILQQHTPSDTSVNQDRTSSCTKGFLTIPFFCGLFKTTDSSSLEH